MNVLVLNAGSSTLKFQLIATSAAQMADGTDRRLARGVIERIGGEAVLTTRAGDGPWRKSTAALRDLRGAVEHIVRWLASEDTHVIGTIGDINAVGHRVVHGGERFTRSVRIDDAVLQGIDDTIELAPLHNPHNLKGIQAARAALGADVPQVAVFDTAFHATLPDYAYLYAIPYQLYRRYKVRRYGFHGTSHRYVAWRWRQLTGRPREGTRLVTLHLGNGCSACAIRNGESIDISMGFTPLEGLVMGTRSGDIDPAVLDFVAQKEGLSLDAMESLLNKQSGLLGVSGLTNDMRDLLAEAEEHDDRRARLAVDIFCYRVRKYVGAYLAAMDGADAILFTGGIGENSPVIREKILGELRWLGIELDSARNAQVSGGLEGPITTAGSRLAAWVVPTDEELLIARDTVRVVQGLESRY
jgi:acetate kinase